MMVNIHRARAQLSELLERATQGEEVVIAKRDGSLQPTGLRLVD